MGARDSIVGMLCAALLLALLGVAVTAPASAQSGSAAEVGLASGTCRSDPQRVNQFPDVADDSVFCNDIAWLAEQGITTGRADGSFGPGDNVLRGQMAAFLHRYDGEPAPPAGAPTFSDVAADHVFFTAISWLAAEGITTGRPDGTFNPGGEITRGQMAAFLYRYAGEPELPDDAPTFPDVPAGFVFEDAISWMAQLEITTGRSDGTFDPGGSLNRGQMAAFLARFDRHLNAPDPAPEPGPDPQPDPDQTGPSNDPRVPADWDLASGTVEVTLVWSGGETLSLTVTDPNGDTLGPDSGPVASGGMMDRVDTPTCAAVREIHGNHAVWQDAPLGAYVAEVSLDQRCDYHGHFRIEARVNGEVVDSISGPTDFDTSAEVQPRVEFEVTDGLPDPEPAPDPETPPVPDPEPEPDAGPDSPTDPTTDVSIEEAEDAVTVTVSGIPDESGGLLEDGTAEVFIASEALTRGETMALLIRAMRVAGYDFQGVEVPGDVSFADVDADHEFHEDIVLAVAAMITGGIAPDEFGPDLPVLRSTGASFLVRVLSLLGIEGASGDGSGFDGLDSSAWWASPVEVLVNLGLLEPEGDFRPDEELLRGELLAWMEGLPGLVEDPAPWPPLPRSVGHADVSDGQVEFALPYPEADTEYGVMVHGRVVAGFSLAPPDENPEPDPGPPGPDDADG